MTYGVPETIVSDNGSQFRAVGFKKLIQQYGVTHVYGKQTIGFFLGH